MREGDFNDWIMDFPAEMRTFPELLGLMEALAWDEGKELPSMRLSASFRTSTATPPWGKFDLQVVALVNAMNSMSGVRTFESCCGHSKEPFSIWFVSKSVDAVRPLYEIIAPYKDWSIIVDRDFSRDFMFELRGPRGKAAYLSAEKIADDINRKVNGGGN